MIKQTVAGFVLALVAGSCHSAPLDDHLLTTVMQVENRMNARVGVVVRDLARDRVWGYRAEERFPMASTFKTLACGALLARVDAGEEKLERRVTFEISDLVSYSPVFNGRQGPTGVTLREACEATLMMSDNTAANLVLESLGGPEELTGFLRSIGDQVTRLDRFEPDVNQALVGDPRDTTSPAAMSATLQKLIVDDGILTDESQGRLKEWMMNNRVADDLLRASLPSTWTIADRSGAGRNGTRAIAAVLWTAEDEPTIVTIYMTETDASFHDRNHAIAEIGEAIVDVLSRK